MVDAYRVDEIYGFLFTLIIQDQIWRIYEKG